MQVVAEPRTRAGLGVWGGIGLALLLADAVYRLVGILQDLYMDTWEHHAGSGSFGLPTAQEPILARASGLAGVGYMIKGGETGLLEFISQVETAYALTQLVVVALFLVLLVFPFRERRRWAWFACWLVVLGDVGGALTFGPLSDELLVGGLVSAAVLAVLLLAHVPFFFSLPGHAGRVGV